MKLLHQHFHVAIRVVLFALLSTVSVMATVVVDWVNSNDYVSSTLTFTPATGSTTVVGTARIYPYLDSVLRPPVSEAYTPPAGTTGYFNTAAWIDNSGATALSLTHRIFDHSAGDRISFSTGSQPASLTGAVFVSFLQPNFLNGANTQTVRFGLDEFDQPVGSLSVNIANVSGNPLRFAVLNDGTWYLSSASGTTGTFTISSANILTSTWAEWSPTGGDNGRLAPTPGTFEVLGSSFQDIQGFGYFGEFSTAGNVSMLFETRGFQATAIAIPEPAFAALLFAVVGAIVLLRRRR